MRRQVVSFDLFSKKNLFHLSKAIRRLTFAVEEIWHPDFYPLQRSDVALDRISQLVSELGVECREINLVKWPRLQDDTIIDHTYAEMQAGSVGDRLNASRRWILGGGCDFVKRLQLRIYSLHLLLGSLRFLRRSCNRSDHRHNH